MIGTKIKMVRTQLGLSQKQLAGNALTRSYISLIESGKCTPSIKTLSVIAASLGRPVEFFLADEEPTETVETIYRVAEKLFNEKSYVEALDVAIRALKLSKLACDLKIEGDIHYLIGSLQARLGRYDDACDSLEQAGDIFRSHNQHNKAIQVLYEHATVWYLMEEYKIALRYYQKLLRLTVPLKVYQDVALKAFIYAGSASYRLGEFQSALSLYQNALKELRIQCNPKLEIETLMGLGWVHFKLGANDLAIDKTRQGMTKSRLNNDYLLSRLEHNYGIFLVATEQWDEALNYWERCLALYIADKDLIRIASVQEDISGYWLHMKDYQRAKDICFQALDQLETTCATIQRGRIYRQLGIIFYELKEVELSLNYLRLAMECFRRLKAAEELDETMKLFFNVT